MHRHVHRHAILAFAVLLCACAAGEPQNDAVVADALPGGMPVSVQSGEARQYLADGVRELDFNRIPEAYANFEQAGALEPGFALAHLFASATAPTPQMAFAHLGHAAELAPKANEFERLLVETVALTVRGDNAGGQKVAQQLVERYADNPRAWWIQAWAYQQSGQTAEIRTALQKAIDVAPDFTTGYMQLAELYTLSEQQDLERAEQLLRKAIELEPRESYVHDLLGDVFRGQGRLEEAAAEYTLAAELDPTSGGPFQQRAHVNTFLGRYAEARADYDASIALAKGNSKAGFAGYRPLVHVFEGNPRAAIDEYERLLGEIDGMQVPDPEGMKMTALYWQLGIANHHRMLDVADRATQRIREIRERRIASLTEETARRNERIAILVDAGFQDAYHGRYEAARRKAAEAMRMREQETAANKNWAANELLGTTALLQGRHEEALQHLANADPSQMYPVYLRAVALERLGRTAEATALYKRLDTYYFNDPGVSVVRKEVALKARG